MPPPLDLQNADLSWALHKNGTNLGTDLGCENTALRTREKNHVGVISTT